MKKNIEKRKDYWCWIEYCDRCGKEICDNNSKTIPKENNVDFCIHCLKFFLVNNVPYSFAAKLYGGKNEN